MVGVIRMTVRRLLLLVPLVMAVAFLVFVVVQFAPNDPAYNALGTNATPAARHAWIIAHGLNQPLPVQYLRFLGQALHGSLGVTQDTNQPVVQVVGRALPVTLALSAFGLVIAIVVAGLLGATAAMYRNRWPDQVIRAVSMAGLATPSFWLGIMMIQFFALHLGWFPSGGFVGPSQSFTGWLQSLALPSIALGVPVGASLSRALRASMVEELDKGYVRTAIGNGLPTVVVVGRNVLRNALVTPLTVLGLTVGTLIGGALVIETIFDLPGMGTLLLHGVTNGDAGLVEGIVLTVAIGFILANLAVDILLVFVNPRLRGGS
ncbi:ABC transporter permease [Ferrimicrobium sp.]|uniref:ABC transporter permease n=1 Tax=Ferrimicrobium sp. TaxID=2926050 RepID=UPI00345D9103